MEDRIEELFKKSLLHKLCSKYREMYLYREDLAEEILQQKHPEAILDSIQIVDCVICHVEKNLQIGNYRRAWHLLGMLHFLCEENYNKFFYLNDNPKSIWGT